MKNFCKDQSGATAVFFTVMLVPLMAATGAAIDYSRSVNARTQLQAAVDAAVLSVNTTELTSQAQATFAVNEFATAQLSPSLKLYDLNISVELSADGRSISATANAYSKNAFMQIVGIPSTEIAVRAQANRGLDSSVELALVLDNTGSMSANGKLTTLKTSATMLINTLTSDPKNKVKIALVPFGQYVNVGLGNRGASWLSNTTDYSTTTNVAASCKKTKPITKTYNCQMIDTSSNNDGVITTGKKQVCQYEYGDPVETCTPASTKVNNFKWTGCVGSRPYPSNLNDDAPSSPYPGLYNTTCTAALIPLTTNFTGLKTAINGMTATGETYGPSGLVWGLNVLSPSLPFNEGGAYDANKMKPRKVLVFMTDGVNTKSMTSTTASTHNGANRTEADGYSSKLCDNVKAKGIEVFSIALMVDDAAAKTMLQQCATDSSHYYAASDATALEEAFKKIAYSLQNHYMAR